MGYNWVSPELIKTIILRDGSRIKYRAYLRGKQVCWFPLGQALATSQEGPARRRLAQLLKDEAAGRLTWFSLANGCYETLQGDKIYPQLGNCKVVTADGRKAWVRTIKEAKVLVEHGLIEGESKA